MATQQADKRVHVAAVTEELVREGEGNILNTKAQITISKGHFAAYWTLAVVAIGATLASITATVAALVGVQAMSSPRTLLLALVVIWPLWLFCVVATLVISPKIGHNRSGGTMRWRLMRWAAISMLILGPFLGQLMALGLGIGTLFQKNLETRRIVRPTALAYLCVGLGWPAMFVTAIYALGPLFFSEVHFMGPEGPTTMMDLALASHTEPLTSLYLVYGSSGLLALIVFVTALALWRHQRARARQARDAFSGVQMLQAGESVVRGTVALASGTDVAVRIEVDQDGTESENSGSWSHTWTEVDRRVMVSPFYLEHASGERIRVEPTTKEVHLMDDLDGVILVDLAKRKRFAELIPGEQVVATGQLRRSHDPEAGDGGYRGGGQAWVLTPPKLGPMLLSTKPLDAPFARRSRNYAIMAVLVSIVAIVGNILLIPYHQRVWTAQTITATITGRNVTTSTDDDGDLSHSYHMAVSNVDPPLAIWQDVAEEVYNGLPEWSHVPVLYVASRPESSQLGHVPRANGIIALILALAITFIQFFFLARGEYANAWYNESKIVDNGSGMLPKPSGAQDGGKTEGLMDMG